VTDAAKFILEVGEQFLRHPCGPQEPMARPAIFDFEAGKVRGVGHVMGLSGFSSIV
jgi:hypothetical protein